MQPKNLPVKPETIQEIVQVGESFFDSFALEQFGKAFNLIDENIDLLKGVPFVQTIVLPFKLRKQIETHTMRKKLYKFLTQLTSISEDERTKFEKKLESDPKFKEKILDHLGLTLEKIDDMEKSQILGNVFLTFIRGGILEEEYYRLSAMINRSYATDLKELYKNHSDLSTIDLLIRKQLASDGFRQEQTINDIDVFSGGEGWEDSEEKQKEKEIQQAKEQDRLRFSVTRYGQLFLELNLYSD
ncbi:hypothetical protein [Spirulina sp. 06S082]|uniref:hypothetical protein n=1 Tax=Spirulina sp. 06S082 TaxID=3110248 RepID=UPI002B2094F5|nr:hypothetical protein [Spirulina sp. 06S082]MEA5467706.1 hypothetical protein [Spirulina sp. 06S082]